MISVLQEIMSKKKLTTSLIHSFLLSYRLPIVLPWTSWPGCWESEAKVCSCHFQQWKFRAKIQEVEKELAEQQRFCLRILPTLAYTITSYPRRAILRRRVMLIFFFLKLTDLSFIFLYLSFFILPNGECWLIYSGADTHSVFTVSPYRVALSLRCGPYCNSQVMSRSGSYRCLATQSDFSSPESFITWHCQLMSVFHSDPINLMISCQFATRGPAGDHLL